MSGNSMKNENVQAIVVMNYVMPSLVSLVVFGFLVARIINLKKVARHTKLKLNWPLCFRITLICVDIGIEITAVFLSSFYDSYYTYHKTVVFLVFFTLMTMATQIILMVNEFNKNVPLYFMHKIYWLLIQFLVSIGLIVTFSTDSIHAEMYILEVFRFVDFTLLNVYTLFVRRQDIYDFEKQPFFSNELPQIQDSYIVDQYRMKSMTNYSTSDMQEKCFITVVLQQGWSLVQISGDVKVEVKLDIYLPTRMYKVKHTIDEFIHLWSKLEFENKTYLEAQQIEHQEFKSFVIQLEQSTTTSQTIQILKKFISKLTSRIDLASQSMITFFAIPQPEASEIANKRLWKMGLGESNQYSESKTEHAPSMEENRYRQHSKIIDAPKPATIIDKRKFSQFDLTSQPKKKRSQTIVVPEEQPNPAKQASAKQYRALDIDSEFLQYFDVQVKSTSQQGKPGSTHTVYHIAISLILPRGAGHKDQPNSWLINKRYTDFFELDQTLKVFLGIKQLPHLPKKKLATLDEVQTAERQHGLEQYLKSLLNDKMYHHYSLFKFIELSKELEEAVRQYQTVLSQSTESFEDMCVVNQGHELVIDERKGYVRYNFQLQRKNGENISTFQKRFSEFPKLHYSLKTRFNNDAQLPELPPKYTSFGQKTSALVREKQLSQYLNQMFKVYHIQESVHFRQFISYRSKNQQVVRKSSNATLSRKNSSTTLKVNNDTVIANLDQEFKTLDQINEEDENKLDSLYLKQSQNELNEE